MDVDVVRQPDRLSFRAQAGLSPPSLGRIPEPVRPQHLFLCVKVWLSVSAYDSGYFQLAPQDLGQDPYHPGLIQVDLWKDLFQGCGSCFLYFPFPGGVIQCGLSALRFVLGMCLFNIMLRSICIGLDMQNSSGVSEQFS